MYPSRILRFTVDDYEHVMTNEWNGYMRNDMILWKWNDIYWYHRFDALTWDGQLSVLLSLRNRVRQVLLELHKLLKLRWQIPGILIIRLSALLLRQRLWLRRVISAVLRIVLLLSGGRWWIVLLLGGGRWIVLSRSYGNLFVGRLLRLLTDLYFRPILTQLGLIYVLRLDRFARSQIRYGLRWKMYDRIASLLSRQYLPDRRRRLIVISVITLLYMILSSFPDVAWI